MRPTLDPVDQFRALRQRDNRYAQWTFSPPMVLTLLTLVGTVLRLFHLGTKSLWMDEAASVALARMSWRQYAWVWWRQEGNMTAYYLLLRPWLHLGQSETWIRLLSVVFGIAAIPAIFYVTRRLTDTTTALMAAALLAVSPAHIYYSQEARSYSLTMFLLLLSSFFFVRAVMERRDRRLGTMGALRNFVRLCSLLRCVSSGGARRVFAVAATGEGAMATLLRLGRRHRRTCAPGNLVRVVAWKHLELAMDSPSFAPGNRSPLDVSRW